MEGMKFGYARVSTDEQTPALQLAALRSAGSKRFSKMTGYQEPRQTAQPCSGV